MTLIHMAVIPERVNRRGNKVPEFVVDDCLAASVCSRMWHFSPKKYLKTTDGTRLHQFVWSLAGRVPCEMIDHINGDKLDNRLENLRPADATLNAVNRQMPRKVSGLPQGVRRGTRSERYRAAIKVKGRSCNIGTFDTVEEASAAYQEMRGLIIKHRAAKIAELARGR